MREEIEEVLTLMKVVEFRLRRLTEQSQQWEDDKRIPGVRVDLGHARHALERATSYVRRLQVNGRMPWDDHENR